MRIKIIAKSKKRPAFIPIQYNACLQGFIYKLLKEKMPKVHDIGYRTGNLCFRHFTFSRIFSKGMKKQKNHFKIENNLYFYISFSTAPMTQTILEEIMNDQTFSIGKETFQVISIKTYNNPFKGENSIIQMDFQTLSPIVNYKTIKNEVGKKKTVYYSPFDKEFISLTKTNLVKKINSLKEIGSVKEEDFSYHVVPINIDPDRAKCVVIYRNIVIEGYIGIFRFKGSSKLAEIAYDAGFGSKNSQGFGMIKVKNIKKPDSFAHKFHN